VKKTEIGQPKKAWEEKRVTIVFKQRALEPRVVQAKIVYPPVIQVRYSPVTQAEVYNARHKKDKRRKNGAYLGSPFG